MPTSRFRQPYRTLCFDLIRTFPWFFIIAVFTFSAFYDSLQDSQDTQHNSRQNEYAPISDYEPGYAGQNFRFSLRNWDNRTRPREHCHRICRICLTFIPAFSISIILDTFSLSAEGVTGFRCYFSCRPLGLNGQAGPVLVDPHQMHLFAPCPWQCLPVGENWHTDPYDDEPHHSQCFSSSIRLYNTTLGYAHLRF